MKRLNLLVAFSAVLFGCGGSDAGSVFDQNAESGTESDSGATGGDSSTTEDTGGTTTEDTTPGGEDGDPPPPIDSGDPPPPVDSGVPGIDTGPVADIGPKPDIGPSLDGTVGVPCTEPGGKMYGGHCYFPLNPRTFMAARDFCISLKAHLVTITSDGEQKHVVTVGYNDRWIGLARAEGSPPSATSFKWINGETVGYTYWDSGEPNGSGFCTRLRDADGRWADISCGTTLPAVCERE